MKYYHLLPTLAAALLAYALCQKPVAQQALAERVTQSVRLARY